MLNPAASPATVLYLREACVGDTSRRDREVAIVVTRCLISALGAKPARNSCPTHFPVFSHGSADEPSEWQEAG